MGDATWEHRPQLLPRRSLSFLLVCLAAACCVVAIPAGAANHTGPSHFDFVYKGSGTGRIAQFVDSTRPDTKPNWDVYSKHVDWTITWHATLQSGSITSIGKPQARVSGSGRGLVRSNPSMSCSGPVKLPTIKAPGAHRGPYAPIELVVLARTSSSVTVRIDGTSSAISGFPLIWADVPACKNGGGNAVAPLVAYNRATVNWGKAWGAPEFKIGLHGNFKVTPFSIGGSFPFKPQANQRQVTFDYHATLRVQVR
jgi:hypothetical protein